MIELDDFSLLVFGAFVSGIIGLVFSWINQNIKEKIETARVAKGFHLEIMELTKIIGPIVGDYRAMGVTVGSPFLLETLVARSQFDTDRSLYTNNGWYFVFQKDLVLFDKRLLEATILFYRKIVYANTLLQEYFKVLPSRSDHMALCKIQDKFFKSLDSAYALTPSLLTGYAQYDKKQQAKQWITYKQQRVKQWIAFNILSIAEV